MAQLSGIDYSTFLSRAAEVETARAAYANLNDRLDSFVLAGGNTATLTNGTAAAGQKNVTVDNATGFIASGRVAYTLAGGGLEYNAVASIGGPTTVTLTTNIGTGGIADNTLFVLISESEYQAAQAINHSGSLTLPATMGYAAHGIYNAAAYGLSPTNSAAANLTALNAVTAAALSSNIGATIIIPPGTYSLASTWTISNAWGLVVSGAGHQTKFSWSGTSGSPAIALADSRNCLLGNFQISVGSGANPLSIGIRIYRTTASPTVVPKDNTIRDVWMQGTAGYLYTGIQIGGSGASDQNNDFNMFERVVINNYRDYGVDGSTQATQSYGNIFLNCQFLGVAGTSLSAVYTGATGFCFCMNGGMTYGNDSDFNLGRHYQPYLIDGVTGEGSKRILYSNHGTYSQVCLRNGRWSGELLHADGNFVDFTAGRGQLFIENYSFGDGQSPTGVARIKVALASGAAGGWFEMRNCRIYSTDTTPFSSDFPSFSRGNLIITDEATSATSAMEPCYKIDDAALAPSVSRVGFVTRTSTTGIIWLEDGLAGQIVSIWAQNSFTIYHNYAGATQPIFTKSAANISAASGDKFLFACNGAAWHQIA